MDPTSDQFEEIQRTHKEIRARNAELQADYAAKKAAGAAALPSEQAVLSAAKDIEAMLEELRLMQKTEEDPAAEETIALIQSFGQQLQSAVQEIQRD